MCVCVCVCVCVYVCLSLPVFMKMWLAVLSPLIPPLSLSLSLCSYRCLSLSSFALLRCCFHISRFKNTHRTPMHRLNWKEVLPGINTHTHRHTRAHTRTHTHAHTLTSWCDSAPSRLVLLQTSCVAGRVVVCFSSRRRSGILA